MKENLAKTLADHMKADELYHQRIDRLLFGNEKEGEKGMKQKHDEMYDFLMSYKHVTGFFGGFGSTIKWVLLVAGLITMLKSVWATLLAHSILK